MFFNKKYKSRKIRIDVSAVDRDSPEVQRRLDRIERNYEKLDEILSDLESRIALDDRLAIEKDEPLPRKPR